MKIIHDGDDYIEVETGLSGPYPLAEMEAVRRMAFSRGMLRVTHCTDMLSLETRYRFTRDASIDFYGGYGEAHAPLNHRESPPIEVPKKIPFPVPNGQRKMILE